MSGHQREWDENRSPQWKYLLRNESQARRELQKALEKDGEGEIKANKKSRKKKEREANARRGGAHKLNKAGKKIIYTASPGNREDSRWTNKQFLGNVEERKKILAADEGSTDA